MTEPRRRYSRPLLQQREPRRARRAAAEKPRPATPPSVAPTAKTSTTPGAAARPRRTPPAH